MSGAARPPAPLRMSRAGTLEADAAAAGPRHDAGALAIRLPCPDCGAGAMVAPDAVERTCPRCRRYVAFRRCRACRGTAQTDACGPLETWTCPWCDVRNRLDLGGRGPLADAASYADQARRLRPEAVAVGGDGCDEAGTAAPSYGDAADAGPAPAALPPFREALRACSVRSRIGVALVGAGWAATVLGAAAFAAEIPHVYSSDVAALAAVTLGPPALLILALIWAGVVFLAGRRSLDELAVAAVAGKWAFVGVLTSLVTSSVILGSKMW